MIHSFRLRVCALLVVASCSNRIHASPVSLAYPSNRIHGSPVVLGNQMLRDGGYKQLLGHRVAVLSNPTGVFADTFEHIVDHMHGSGVVDLVLILGPEHGFRGEKQAETGDSGVYNDSVTGLPVYSAYKAAPPQIADFLTTYNITSVVVDMQDVGVRLYTFVWCMFSVMQAAALTQHTRVLVLDRPNPLGGERVEGPLLNLACCTSGYGRAPITHIHGMTIGELALLFNAHLFPPLPPLSLEVIEMDGWKRAMTFPDTGLPWVPPSPNIPSFDVALGYGVTVFLEATTLAEGRGTTTPFLQFGAPFLNAQEVAKDLNYDLGCKERACFRAAYFEPTFFKYNNTLVEGVQWVPARGGVTFLQALQILIRLKNLSPVGNFSWDGSWFGHPGSILIDSYAGTPRLREMIDDGIDAVTIHNHFSTQSDAFSHSRQQYLLYK